MTWKSMSLSKTISKYAYIYMYIAALNDSYKYEYSYKVIIKKSVCLYTIHFV